MEQLHSILVDKFRGNRNDDSVMISLMDGFPGFTSSLAERLTEYVGPRRETNARVYIY